MRVRELAGWRKKCLTATAGMLAALAADSLSAFMYGEGVDQHWLVGLFAVLCIGLAFFCLKQGEK